MATKKKNTESKSHFTPDMEFLTHKYSDYYNDKRDTDSIDSKDTSYIWYDTRELYYPYYKSRIKYVVSKESPLHPIVLSIFKILEYLSDLKGINILEILQDITQLDNDILGTIISEYQTLGYILESGYLSEKGKEALKQDKQKEIKEEIAYILSDGILGNIIESNKIGKDIKLDSTPGKEAIELKPQGDKRLRTQVLNDIFIESGFEGEEMNEDSNKTLKTMIMEGLKGLDFIESSADSKDFKNTESKSDKTRYRCDVLDIIEVQECKKYFRKYICLFYKNIDGNEKILAINEKYLRDIEKSENPQGLESNESLEENLIDSSATQRLAKLVDNSKFKAKDNNAYIDCKEKFEALDSKAIESKLEINLENGHTISVQEHKKYFIYVLENAKKSVCIQSPWVRGRILKEYQKDIESALNRGVKIYIKFGLDSKHKDDKEPMDNIARKILQELKQKYNDLLIVKKDNSHSKILICDSDFMIVGSFNWLSFGGNSKDSKLENNNREEISSINTNKDSIKKESEKFKNAK